MFLACSAHNIGSGSSSYGRRAFCCLPPAVQHVGPPDLRAFVASQPAIPRAPPSHSCVSYPPWLPAAHGRRRTRSGVRGGGPRHTERTVARARSRGPGPSVRLGVGESPVLKHPQAGDRISHTYHMDGMEPVHCLKLSFRLPLGRRLLISTFKLAYLRLKQRKPLCTRRLCLQKFETRSNFFSTSCFLLLSFD